MSDNINLSVLFTSSILVGGFILQFIAIWIAVKMFQRSLKKDNEEKIGTKLDEKVFIDFKCDQNNKFKRMEADITTLIATNNEQHKELKSDFINKVTDFKEYVKLGFESLEKLITK